MSVTSTPTSSLTSRRPSPSRHSPLSTKPATRLYSPRTPSPLPVGRTRPPRAGGGRRAWGPPVEELPRHPGQREQVSGQAFPHRKEGLPPVSFRHLGLAREGHRPAGDPPVCPEDQGRPHLPRELLRQRAERQAPLRGGRRGGQR